MATWIVVLLGLVEKVDNNQTSDFGEGWHGFSVNSIATDVTSID
jgi:hypothetical protein